MKVSPNWTPEERLQVVYQIAKEINEAGNVGIAVRADLRDWAVKLAYVASETPEFLEQNRRNFKEEIDNG